MGRGYEGALLIHFYFFKISLVSMLLLRIPAVTAGFSLFS
jgi:hypothetical protein